MRPVRPVRQGLERLAGRLQRGVPEVWMSSRKRRPGWLLCAVLTALLVPEAAEARVRLRIRPRLRVPKVGKAARTRLSRIGDSVGVRRRAKIREREATLGGNPRRYKNMKKKTGENPEHVRNQDELVAEAQRLAKDQGVEIVGPTVAYYRTTHGRIIRVRPNRGTGNLREAARLRPGENLARLEDVAFVTTGNRLIRVSSTGTKGRLQAFVSRPLAAAGAIALPAAAFFAKDVLRWIGIRESAAVIEDKVKPEQPGTGIRIGEGGEIEIDENGDGRAEVEIDRPDRVLVEEDDGRVSEVETSRQTPEGEDVVVIRRPAEEEGAEDEDLETEAPDYSGLEVAP